jgi:hypothetical protein
MDRDSMNDSQTSAALGLQTRELTEAELDAVSGGVLVSSYQSGGTPPMGRRHSSPPSSSLEGAHPSAKFHTEHMLFSRREAWNSAVKPDIYGNDRMIGRR